MRKRLWAMAALLAAACTPAAAPPPKPDRAIAPAPLTTPAPRPEIQTPAQIGRALAGGRCGKPRTCGAFGYVDCGAALDGPAYYYELRTGRILSFCGGYCMRDTARCARDCPPPQWRACRG